LGELEVNAARWLTRAEQQAGMIANAHASARQAALESAMAGCFEGLQEDLAEESARAQSALNAASSAATATAAAEDVCKSWEEQVAASWEGELRTLRRQEDMCLQEVRVQERHLAEMQGSWQRELEAAASAAAKPGHRASLRRGRSSVNITEEGSLGLVFEEGKAPPTLMAINSDVRSLWSGRGVFPGMQLLFVNGQSVAALTTEQVVPLFSQRPLALDFAKPAQFTHQSGEVRLSQKWPSSASGDKDDGLPDDLNTIGLLHDAARHGEVAKCLAILRRPDFTSVNVQDTLGRTALHWAAAAELDLVCDVILARPDFTAANARDWTGSTYQDLRDAARKQREQQQQQLAEHPGW